MMIDSAKYIRSQNRIFQLYSCEKLLANEQHGLPCCRIQFTSYHVKKDSLMPDYWHSLLELIMNLLVDEMAMFEQRLGTALLSPNQRELIRQALKAPPPLDECLAGLSDEAGRLALRDAVLMAAADGTVDDDEKEVLTEIIAHLGLPDGALERLLKWTVEGYNWMQSGYDILNDLAE